MVREGEAARQGSYPWTVWEHYPVPQNLGVGCMG